MILCTCAPSLRPLIFRFLPARLKAWTTRLGVHLSVLSRRSRHSHMSADPKNPLTDDSSTSSSAPSTSATRCEGDDNSPLSELQAYPISGGNAGGGPGATAENPRTFRPPSSWISSPSANGVR